MRLFVTIAPITPSQAIRAQSRPFDFPEYVIEAFNNLLSDPKLPHRLGIVKQDTVIEEIIKVAEQHGVQITRQEIFAQHLLDVENNYRALGWDVQYFKPPYNSDSVPYFVFEPRQ
jgi:hypothetical protein